jgi:hypothetical protein
MRLDRKGAAQLEVLQRAKRLHVINVLASAASQKKHSSKGVDTWMQ